MNERVLMTIPSLRGGGAERVFALIAGGLSRLGLDVHLALAQSEGPWLATLPSSVAVHNLDAPHVRLAAWPLIRLVRRIRPACVLSTMAHMNVLVGLVRASFPARTKVILRESTFLHLEDSFVAHRPGVMHRMAYRAADRIVCLTEGMRRELHRQFRIPSNRIVPIFNPIDVRPSERIGSRQFSGPGPHIVSVGRMDESKGFDRLIAAFPACLSGHPHSTLTILGDGPDRPSLEAQIAKLGIADRVTMPGFHSDVRRWLHSADLFVLSSRFEGLPNVLLEAIEAECPVAVLDHPGGTREVLELLGLSRRLTENLTEWRPEWFERPEAVVREAALRHFGLETIVQQYADLVRPVAARQRLAA